MTVDDQEATMLTASDRAAYRLMADREPFSDPRRVGPRALEHLRALAAKEGRDAPPPGVPAEEWGPVLALRTRMFTDEACRLYAVYLLKGDAQRAGEAAGVLLGAHDDGASRLALVMTAVVARAPEGAEHARWVREAAAMGASSPSLDRLYPPGTAGGGGKAIDEAGKAAGGGTGGSGR
jgi:hypothetical protein